MFNSLIFGLLFACGEKEADTSEVTVVDADADGFAEADDCDDSNAAINPDAEELCDGVDNNCDDEIDNDATDALTFYEDYDEDGFGDAEVTEAACEAPDGFVDNMDDCNDVEATVNPDAPEVCDEMDNDCDDLIDDADDGVDTTTGSMFYADTDADGFGDEAVMMEACAAMEGYVANMNDCDDTVENIDGDGDGYLDCKGDCDDEDAMTYPGAAESDSETACMRDADEDGFGELKGHCILVEMLDDFGDGWVASSGNGMIEVHAGGMVVETYELLGDDDCEDLSLCNDDSSSTYKAVEVCAGSEELELHYTSDNFAYENSIRITDAEGNVTEYGDMFFNADGDAMPAAPEGEDGPLFTVEATKYELGSDCDDEDNTAGSGDLDGDGYDACDLENPMDCDDSDAAINPGVDADEDGFNMCIDCDETSADINPDADEVWYDGVDQNCDGWSDYDMDMDGSDAMMYIDPADGETEVMWTGYDCDDNDETLLSLSMESDATACYSDDDGDGYGDSDPSEAEMEDGAIAGTDCDDYSAWYGTGGEYTYPGAAELEADPTLCMQDDDEDGYANSDLSESDIEAGIVPGVDCDDGSEFAFPGAAELEADPTLCMEDEDEDGYGGMAGSYDDFESGTDCDDDDAAINPTVDADADGANVCEDCDDDDASAQGLMGYVDADGDGFGSDSSGMFVCSLDEDGDGTEEYVAEGGDCYDSSWSSTAPYIYPGAAFMEEDVDGDGVIDCTEDGDGDGYGSIGSYYADVDGTDCDDDDEYTFPGAGYLESSPIDEQCLTDADEDGYAAGVPAIAEFTATNGDCYTITMSDTYSDGCNGYLDIYVDGALFVSYQGPASDSSVGYSDDVHIEYEDCSLDGMVQLGWTEATSYNNECYFTMTDAQGNEVYSSTGTIPNTVPGGGTDSDDGDSSVQ